MKVILLEKIANLGGVGDQVDVKAGYARNFLIPQDKAVMATSKNIADFETRRADLEAKAQAVLEVAQKQAAALNGQVLEIAARASDEGKLFGSVGPREIEIAAEAAGLDIKKQAVLLPEGPIRLVGEYPVHVHLHSDVDATITVNVVAE